jgi:uncharacterized protein (DUF885 family)
MLPAARLSRLALRLHLRDQGATITAMPGKLLLPLIVVLTMGCSRKPSESVAQLRDEFVYRLLSFSPVTATQVGYHQHEGVNLDSLLDDVSQAALERQRQFCRQFRQRLTQAVRPADLSAEDRADYDLISDQISLQLLELDEIQNWRHNPTVYVELIGSALFYPYVLEYAPKPERYRQIVSRLEKLPAFLDQARQNLAAAPEIWRTVAIEENDGNIGLVDKTLRQGAPAELRADYDKAATTALAALRSFNDFLKNDLAKQQGDWRLGKEKYASKFRYVIESDQAPEQVLAAAEQELRSVRKQMFDLALPLHHKMYPTHKDPVDLNLIVGETLARIAGKHATPDTYFTDARRDLKQVTEFVREKNLVPLPKGGNLEVIETPEFMRGIYAVGGFVPAPALEPQLGAFYWITPIPKTWPRQRIESKLREYNFYALKLLTIHEAMPGHYLQFEYANQVQPQGRRVLRALFGNGAYIEGWAVYATEMMLDEGYLDNSPELRLTFLKQQLRMLANAILDVRLQTMGMTDQEAMDLMVKQTFQENEEATAKLQRAKLSSCQLPTYFMGWRDWRRVREMYKQAKGASFQLEEFHRQALAPGSIPMPSLARILTGKPLGE